MDAIVGPRGRRRAEGRTFVIGTQVFSNNPVAAAYLVRRGNRVVRGRPGL